MAILYQRTSQENVKEGGIEPPPLTRIPLTLPYRVRREAPAGLAEFEDQNIIEEK